MDQENECLEELKKSVKGNKSLDNLSPILSDRFLIHFVRGRKYDSKKAYETLLGYIEIRRGKHKEWFKSIRPTELQKSFSDAVTILKHRDSLNRVIVLADFALWDARETSLDTAMKIVTVIIDEAMNFEDCEKNGIVIILDFAGYSFGHAKMCTPFSINKVLQLFYKNVPLSYQSIHIVNAIPLFTMMFNTLKFLLPKKMNERLQFHSRNYESLHGSLSLEILPISLGGNLTREEAFDQEFEPRIFNKDNYYETFWALL